MALHDTDVHRFMAFGVAGLSVLADSLLGHPLRAGARPFETKGSSWASETQGSSPPTANDDDRVDGIARGPAAIDRRAEKDPCLPGRRGTPCRS